MNENQQPSSQKNEMVHQEQQPLSLQPPRNWDSLPNREKTIFRDKQIEAITAWLATISDEEVNLQSIPPRISNETESSASKIQIENRSVVDVQIDQRALQILLKICGVTESADIEQLKIVLRTATIASKDLFGNPTGGALRTDENGSEIEVVSSAPEDYAEPSTLESLTKISHVILPFTEEMVADSIAHELRHLIQIKTGMYGDISGSYAAKEHDELSYEQDANAFGNSLRRELSRFIKIRNNPNIAGVNTRTISKENKLVKAGWAKPGEAIMLMGEDNQLISLSLQRKQLLQNMGAVDISEATDYMSTVHASLQAEKIGYAEYRLLLKEALQAATGVDLGLQIYFQSHLDNLEALAT